MAPPPRPDDERSWEAWRQKTHPRDERYWETQRRAGWPADGSSSSRPPPVGSPRRLSSPDRNFRKVTSPIKGSESAGLPKPRSPPRTMSDVYRQLETRTRGSSTEPGEIAARRSRSPERPREGSDSRPSTSYLAPRKRSRSPGGADYEGSRSRGNLQDAGKRPVRSQSSSRGDDGVLRGEPGSVALGLQEFTRTMHAALVSTSSLALAARHLTRMRSFSRPFVFSSAGLALSEAQRRVDETERELNRRMIELQDALTVLLKRAIAVPGVAEGDVRNLELDGIRERLAKLEESPTQSMPIGTPPAPSTAPPPLPVTEDVEMAPGGMAAAKEDPTAVDSSDRPTRQEKRSRAKELLNDLITRVESVEQLKTYLEERCDDMENEMWLALGDDATVRDMSWRALEKKRLKGKRWLEAKAQEGGDEIKGQDQENNDEDEWALLESKRNPVVAGTTDQSALDLALEVQALKREVEALRNTTTNGQSDGEDTKPGIQALADEVQALRKELEAERATKSQRELEMAKHILTATKKDLPDLVRKEISRAAASMRAAKALPSVPETEELNGQATPLIPSSTLPHSTPSTQAAQLPHVSPSIGSTGLPTPANGQQAPLVVPQPVYPMAQPVQQYRPSPPQLPVVPINAPNTAQQPPHVYQPNVSGYHPAAVSTAVYAYGPGDVTRPGSQPPPIVPLTSRIPTPPRMYERAATTQPQMADLRRSSLGNGMNRDPPPHMPNGQTGDAIAEFRHIAEQFKQNLTQEQQIAQAKAQAQATAQAQWQPWPQPQ